AELDLLSHRSSRAERHERVVAVVILLGQLAAARPRGLAAGRDMAVLGQPHGFEPARLRLRREVVRLDRIVGRKHGDAAMHRVAPGEWRPSLAAGRRGPLALRTCVWLMAPRPGCPSW